MKQKIGIFLILAGILASTINSWNAKSFGLQNATVAGLVEQQTFAVYDEAIPGFRTVIGQDIFRFKQALYPMKQPGQALVGAIVYWPLKKMGIDFVHHFDYASNLITLATSGMFIAGTAVILATVSGMAAAAIFVLATIVWPYAGVSHHDIYALLPITLAIYCFIKKRYFWAGAAAGVTWFFSMLPLTLPLVLGAGIIFEKKVRSAWHYTVGFAAGLVPSLIFNQMTFGKFWLFPNLAGQVADTIPTLNLSNLAGHLYYYLLSPATSLFFFSPILIFAVYGLFKLEKRLKVAFLAIVCLHLLHISSQLTYGGYEYGPRYLLPLMPIMAIGIGKYLQLKHGQGAWLGFYFSLAYSVAVAMVGAVTTVMYPLPYSPAEGPATYAPLVQMGKLLSGERPEYRLWPIGIGLIFAGLVVLNLRTSRSSLAPAKKNHDDKNQVK